jgi:hypothetical protein
MDGIVPIRVKNPNKMSENGLPNAEFKFMKKVRDEKAIEIKFERRKAF